MSNRASSDLLFVSRNMRSPLSSSISNQTAAAAAAGSDGCSTGKKTPVSCCSNVGLKRGPWTAEEDEILSKYVKKEGEGRWRTLPKRAGLMRCGKSCRLRWMNYLRPSVKRGDISADEEDLILRLHRLLGNRWSLIAGRIPGRTDNEIKNYWNTHLSKKLLSQGIDPKTHKPILNHINTILANTQSSFPELQPAVPNSYQVSVSPRNKILSNSMQLTGDFEYPRNMNDGFKTGLGDGNEGTSYSKEGGNAKDHDDINLLVPDEAFSSFLNSLINDDMFNNKQQLQEQGQLEVNNHMMNNNYSFEPSTDNDPCGVSPFLG